MMAKTTAFIDAWLKRLVSRKLLVWATATYLTYVGHVTSSDWAMLSIVYIGTQGAIDFAERFKKVS
jgi:hypothetical protein